MKPLLFLALSLPCFAATPVLPKVVTEPLPHDSDDPAIWINTATPSASLILGTDKDSDGGLYAFDLQGKIVSSVKGLKRPNNVDVLTGFPLNGKPTDIAVLTEREASRLRVFRLPDLTPLDDGDLAVFSGEKEIEPMGIALYKRQTDGAAFAIVGRKTGPQEGYLWQYRLTDNGKGRVAITLVRKFGTFSGEKEIEAIAVDSSSETVFYSDERAGIRSFPADPDADAQPAIFGIEGFAKDREGIAICGNSIIVSDQEANSMRVFSRKPPHSFQRSVSLAATETDGCDATKTPLGKDFPGGIFVAMSGDRTFHFYALGDITGD